jgi:hypothetical protein
MTLEPGPTFLHIKNRCKKNAKQAIQEEVLDALP